MAGITLWLWTGCVVVALMSVSPNVQAFIDCIADSLLPSFFHHSCCMETNVDINTIRVEFMVVPLGENDWQLDANFTWVRPSANNFNGYASMLDYTEQVTTALYCHNQYALYTVSENEWVYYTNVRFGYRPYFILYTANTTAEVINKKATWKTIEFLDCYEATGSIDFCQTQAVQYASKPLRLRLDSLVAVEQNEGEPLRANLTLAWNPPLQINPDVELYSFQVDLVAGTTDSKTVQILESQSNYTDPFSLSFGETFEGVEARETNDVQVEVRPTVLKKGSLRLREGSSSTLTVDFSSLVKNVPTDGSPTPTKAWQYYVVGGVVVFVLAVVVLFTIYCQCWRNRQEVPQLHLNRSTMMSISDRYSTSKSKVGPKPCFSVNEMDRNQLSGVSASSRIGKGSFGVVYKGYALGKLNGQLGHYAVAVKTLKENASDVDKATFLEEIALMIEIGSHPNILSVLGCCTVDEPYYLITEYMPYGDLLHFLWKTREVKMTAEDSIYDLKEINQFQIAWQIACGMEYISGTRYYHGDLAARNVLVGDNLIVKIADFGLADDIYERGYRQNTRKARPIKWASLETNTTGRYSVESDVWSFGILLYEIVTRGDVPYQDIKDNRQLIDKLKEGYRMERPQECPPELYKIMQKCWRATPSSRPTFTQLHESLDRMLTRRSDYLPLDDSDQVTETKDELMDQRKDFGPASNVGSNELSGKSDTLQLWLHLNGPIPEDAKTLDFVPMTMTTGEGSGLSGTSLGPSIVTSKAVYERDRDGDVLTK